MHSVTKEDIINSNHRIISTHTIERMNENDISTTRKEKRF